MRFFIVIAALLMIPAFAVLMEWRFQSGQRQVLLGLCRERLAQAGLDKVSVALDHFDAQLSGTCADPADRDKAQALVKGVRGLRVNPEDNQIRVPAKLMGAIQGRELRLTGWLSTDGQRAEAVRLVKAARPDLTVVDSGIRTSTHVELGLEAKTQEGSLPGVYSTLLESIRLPASLSISGDGHHYIFKGSLPSAELHDAVLKAAKESAPWIDIDAGQFIAQEHVAGAAFAEGRALADFVKVYFQSPTPGDFQIDQRNGPRLKAYATTAMESAWLSALRQVSGGARVAADITHLPSVYHFPTYQPESKLERSVIDNLRETFRTQTILFDLGSAKVKPPEEPKLGVLADTIFNAGPELHVVVAGYADLGGEPGKANKSLPRTRAENVRTKLIELGVAAGALEAAAFDAVAPPGPLTDEARRNSRSVELLVK